MYFKTKKNDKNENLDNMSKKLRLKAFPCYVIHVACTKCYPVISTDMCNVVHSTVSFLSKLSLVPHLFKII